MKFATREAEAKYGLARIVPRFWHETCYAGSKNHAGFLACFLLSANFARQDIHVIAFVFFATFMS